MYFIKCLRFQLFFRLNMNSIATCYRTVFLCLPPIRLAIRLVKHLISRDFDLTVVRGVVFSSVLCLSGSSWASNEYFNEDQDDSIPYDVENNDIKEGDFEIPELSDESNWVEVEFPALSRSIQFYIDKTSLSLGNDSVLRYFIILRNRSGRTTVYFEGLHCWQRRFKRYAYASGKRPLQVRDQARWKSFSGNTRNYHYVLSQGLFCDTGFGAKTVTQIRDTLTGKRAIDANLFE